MFRCVAWLGLALALIGLAACARDSMAFDQYRLAFDAQHVEGTRALDRLGAAERVVASRRGGAAAGIAAFDPDMAGALLGVGDPPLTGAIRGGLDAVRDYNAALAALASGAAAGALAARMGAAASATSGALGAAAAAAGISAALAPAVEAALATVLPIFRQLAAIEDRAQFRAEFLAAYPEVRALLVTLRAGTPEMFELIKRSYVEPGGLGGVDGVPSADLPRLEQDRRLLAGWVVLLDETLAAMDMAVAALASGGGNAASIAEAAIEVRILAESLNMARLRQ